MIADAGTRPRSGLALLRKPEGLTSFQALSPVKRALASGKVGHAGTLDRFARGLLVVLAGSYSRLAPYIMSGEKLYRGLIAFGSETSTLDPEGEVLALAPPPSRAALEEALPSFRGSILQRPPAYSALHVGGKRAYELALKGIDPELKERRVEILDLELLSYESDRALVQLRCSSGTYVRSLARDIALACGSRAHLAALERLSIGPYLVDEASDPESFDPGEDLRPFSATEAEALGLRVLSLGDDSVSARFSNGGKIEAEAFRLEEGSDSAVGLESAVYGPRGNFLGIIVLKADGPNYKVVMPVEAGERR